MNNFKTITWLTNLYPRAWRERYADEFSALLEQCLHTPLDVIDIFLGALDAHMQLISGESVNWRIMNQINKLRTTILIVFTAFVGFTVAGSALVGLADDSPMLALMQTNIVLAVSWSAIQVGAVIALLAVLVGGLPLAQAVIRSLVVNHYRNRGLLWVPIISFLALALYFGFVVMVSFGWIQIQGVLRTVQPGVFPVGNRLLLAGLMLVFILGAIASTLAIWKVVTGAEVEQGTLRALGRTLNVEIYQFAFIPAVIASLAMLVMLAATVTWGWVSFTALPQVLSGNYGLWQTSTGLWYYGILALMALCTLAAFLGLARGRVARNFISADKRQL